MFGRIYYDLSSGPLMIVSCKTERDYYRELEAACEWVEAEPEAAGVRGVPFGLAGLSVGETGSADGAEVSA